MSSKAKQDALRRLAEQKRTGGSGRRTAEEEEGESELYKVVDEKEYEDIVKKRRQQKDFVVDDEGLGYADDGEEHLDEDEEEGGDDEGDDDASADAAAAGGGGRRAQANPTTVGSAAKNFFGKRGGAGTAAGALDRQTVHNLASEWAPRQGASNHRSGAADVDLDDLLGSIDGAAAAAPARRRALGAASSDMRAATDITFGLAPSSSAHHGLGQGINPFGGAQPPTTAGWTSLEDLGGDGEGATLESAAGEGDAQGEAASAGGPGAGAARAAPRQRIAVAPSRQRLIEAAAAAAKASAAASPAASPGGGGNGLLPVADHWLGASGASAAGDDAVSKALATASGGVIPVDELERARPGLAPLPTERGKHARLGEVDQLMFYWLDAYEDAFSRPGVVLLFGKVMTNYPEYMGALRHNAALAAAQKGAAGAAAASPAAGPGVAPPAAASTTSSPGAAAAPPAAASPLQRPMRVPPPLFASACVQVGGLDRCLYLLPRATHSITEEAVAPLDVYNEFSEVMRKALGSGVKFRCKPVRRSYAFELAGVPREPTEYLKVVYDAKARMLPAHAHSGGTYSHAFGTGASALENFILKRGLSGPGWLRLSAARLNPSPVSWCAYDVVVDGPKLVQRYGVGKDGGSAPADLPLPTPELVVLSLACKTVVEPRRHTHEVVAVSLLTHRAVEQDKPSPEHPSLMSSRTVIRPLSSAAPLAPDLRSAIARLPEGVRATLAVESNERALLNHVLTAIGRADPDVIVGHNVLGFDLDVLLHRIEACNAQQWSRLGRLRRTAMPRTASMGSGGRSTYSGVLTVGRLVADTYLAARELLRETTYTLSSLTASQLGERRLDVDPQDVPRYLTGPSAAALELMRHCENDARLAMRLMFKLQVLPLTKQLTSLAGNTWSRSLRGARAERIEYLLLHEFHRLKFVLPDKAAFTSGKAAAADDAADLDDDADEEAAGRPRGAAASGTIARNSKKRAKPAYTGGLVLEPKRGLYDKYVLLLDFNSLYPSIIQEYNICFTTVDRPLLGDSPATPATAGAGSKRGASSSSSGAGGKKQRKSGGGGRPAAAGGDAEAEEEGSDEDAAAAAEGVGADAGGGADAEEAGSDLPALPDLSRYPEPGVLPRVIRNLVQKRRQVKAMLAAERDPAERQSLDIRQKALKILANSMYGCLGFSASRFYARPIAALVTAQGREILQRTMDLAQDTVGLEVIYGDTDSLFLYTASTDLARVKALGAAVKKEVNKLYRCLEIEIDGIFAALLLLKKKKYAALVIHEGPGGVIRTEREAKGLDLVRRDWCVLSREVGTEVLDLLLSGKERDEIVQAIHAKLTQLAEDVRKGAVALEKFVITKGLNKAPQDYPDVKGQPHLQVALAMIKKGKLVNVGDHVPFVICVEPVGSVEEAAAAAEVEGAAAAAGSSSSTAAVACGSPGERGQQQQQPPANVSFALRAYHPDDVVRSGGKLHIDHEWYLNNQLLPPISRLCEPIEGTSQARLAECLGLDSARFVRAAATSKEADTVFTGQYTVLDEERFRDCEPLFVACATCRHVERFGGVAVPSAAGKEAGSFRPGIRCAESGCVGVMFPTGISGISPPLAHAAVGNTAGALAHCASLMTNLLESSIRSKLVSYQTGAVICDDPMCSTITKGLTTALHGGACTKAGCSGKVSPQVPGSSIHTWIEYLDSLFNVERAKLKLGPTYVVDAETAGFYATVNASVAKFLQRSAYHYISASIFGYVGKVNSSLSTDSSTFKKRGKTGVMAIQDD